MEIEGRPYLRAGTLAVLKQKKAIHLRILGRPVSVFLSDDGAPFAVEMSCKHQGASLAAGVFQGPVVTCPRHGWKYHVVTGACLNADSPGLRRHAIHLDGEAIFVSFHPESR